MDMKSRRKFVASMMATAAASPMLFAQQGGAPGAPGAAAPGGQGGGRRGGGAAAGPPRPRPAGIVWVSGQGSNDGVPNDQKLKITDPLTKHVEFTMAALKRAVERLGGTMNDFLYMQVFFCLPLDDSLPTPTGTAAYAAYQKGYTDIAGPYGAAWRDAGAQAPPRSCFALQWIPGTSLIEVVGAAYIDPNAPVPPRPAAGL